PASCRARWRRIGKRSSTLSRLVSPPRPWMYAPISRFSRTVISGKMRRPSGQCAMPARRIACAGRPSMRASRNVMRPPRGRSKPEIVLAVVLLPAPFAPTRQTSSPAETRRETPRRTSTLPYATRTSSSASIDVAGAEVRANDLRVSLDLARRALGDLLPVIEHHDAIGHAHHHAHVVLDQQDAHALAADVLDQRHHARR